jgi:hypothetical protein
MNDIGAEEDKSNQHQIVFFGKQKNRIKYLVVISRGDWILFSGANVVQSYKKKNARA